MNFSMKQRIRFVNASPLFRLNNAIINQITCWLLCNLMLFQIEAKKRSLFRNLFSWNHTPPSNLFFDVETSHWWIILIGRAVAGIPNCFCPTCCLFKVGHRLLIKLLTKLHSVRRCVQFRSLICVLTFNMLSSFITLPNISVFDM